MTMRWKFLDEENGKIVSRHGDHEWQIGQRYYATGQISACRRGFHCSPSIREAFSYVAGSVLAEVEPGGASDEQGDKSAHANMRIVRAWRFTQKDAVALAVFAANLVLDVFERQMPGDDRPRKAIEAAQAWLDNPTDAAYNAANAACNAYNAAAAATTAAYAATTAAYAAYNAYNAAAAATTAAYAAYAADAANGAAAYAAYNAYNATTAAATTAADAANGAANAAAIHVKIEAWLQGRLSVLEEI